MDTKLTADAIAQEIMQIALISGLTLAIALGAGQEMNRIRVQYWNPSAWETAGDEKRSPPW